MSQSFLLDGTVLFIPGRNLLTAVPDNSVQLALSNPASQCLHLLIQHHGQVVERDVFFQRVWLSNGSQVTNNNFYQNISLLRRAFKEFGLNDELIITVPKVGIRLSEELKIDLQAEAQADVDTSDLSDEREMPAVLVPKRRTCWSWAVFAGAILGGLLALFLLWRSEFTPSLLGFVPLNSSGTCRIYGNPDVLDHRWHEKFIQQNAVDCQHYPWVYLTLYPNVQRVSVLQCRQEYSFWRPNPCISSYYFKGVPHVDA